MHEAKLIKKALCEMEIRYDSRQLEKLVEFKKILTQANRGLNLIGPADSLAIIRKHILDSLAPISRQGKADWDNYKTSILDIGSGGGFPGIPLAIMLRNPRIFLLEKSKKKSFFLKDAIRTLSLDNVFVITARAEELAREEKWREAFSVIVARAVTNFNILLELAIPFCNINGKIIFYKSKKVFSEITAAGNAVRTLGGRIKELIEVDIPGLKEYRVLLVIDKEKSTSKEFPRKFSQIKKKPLE